jgi:hypothetical protein
MVGSGGGGGGSDPATAAAAAGRLSGARGVTGGAGRASRAAAAAVAPDVTATGGGRAAGRRRSSASIVECVRAAASALASSPLDPRGAPLGAARWPPAGLPLNSSLGGGGGGAAARLGPLGLRERFVSLLVKDPSVSLAADPDLAAVLPDFVQVRVSLLARVEEPGASP